MLFLREPVKTVFILLHLLLFWVCTATADQKTVVYTPNGSPVEAWIMDEMSAVEIALINYLFEQTYPNAQRLDNASRTYNCHGYAWHVSEGGNRVWIGYDSKDAEDIYWLDGSYVLSSENEASKVSYASDDHSAVTTKQKGWFISKWGMGPLMRHRFNDSPYNSTDLKFYTRSGKPSPPSGMRIIQ